MKKVLITAAMFQPIELEELKQRPEIHVDGSDHDLALLANLKSAVEAYEEYTDNVLCRSTWDLHFDGFPDCDVIKTPGPLASVVSIKYLDAAGVEQTLPTSCYKVDTSNELAGRIALKHCQSWPPTYPEIDVVTVRITVGYENAAAIPQRIKDGLVLKVQELFDGIDRSMACWSCWDAKRRITI
jgi:uncharacterized phiE125 gp8 family phage protein